MTVSILLPIAAISLLGLGFAARADIPIKFSPDQMACLDGSGSKALRPGSLNECGNWAWKKLSGFRRPGWLFRGVDWTGSQLREFDFQGSNFDGATLHLTSLIKGSLRQILARRANLRGAELKIVDLQNANFVEANLGGLKCTNCDWSHANLSHSSLIALYCENCNFQSVDFRGADLRESVLLRCRFTGAKFNQATLLPFSQAIALEKGMIPE